jgi:hypothetical protein
VSGTVTYSAAPVSGATVTIYSSGLLLYGTATTDTSGNYSIAEVEAGDYTYKVTHTQYYYDSGSTTFNVAGATDRDIAVLPKPVSAGITYTFDPTYEDEAVDLTQSGQSIAIGGDGAHTITISAPTAQASYAWYVDGQLVVESTNTLTLTAGFAPLENAGTHTAICIIGGGAGYTKAVTFMVTEN